MLSVAEINDPDIVLYKHIKNSVAVTYNKVCIEGGIFMKVLMLNGSPRKNGNTSVALREMEKIFAEEGIETKVFQAGGKDIRGCIACGACSKKGSCVFDDEVNLIAPEFEASSGLVVASPV